MKKFTIFIAIVVGTVWGLCCGNFLRAWADDIPTTPEATPIPTKLPELYIKAVNPGYTVDGVSNVGEMIEIGRAPINTLTDISINAPTDTSAATPADTSSTNSFSLAGITVSYTNSSGNTYQLIEFPEYSFMTGEAILLRLASSPEHELAAVNYTKTLAMKGELRLEKSGEILDSVCWTSKDGCLKEFKSSSPTVLVRDSETGEFAHHAVADYTPIYNESSYHMEIPPDETASPPSRCRGLEFSELLSYYETSTAEQFIEFHNTTSESLALDGCQLKYKGKYYNLAGLVGADSYLAYYPTEFGLTKNPTNTNTIELYDVDGTVLDKLEYPNGQRKGTAYAWVGYDETGEELWHTTYAPTPGEPNNYQESKTCEAGKVLNEATGNCVKVTSVTEKICAAGYYLNPLTGRCKKIETTSTTTKECKEGYYLNEETGRCKKITENTGADYGLTPETYEESSSFIGLYLILGVLGIGVIYVIYEFRHELWRLFRKVFR